MATYSQYLYDLFEKHHPGKYSRDYVETILQQNQDSQYEFYVQQCSNFNEEPLPKIVTETVKTTKEKKKQKKKKKKKKKNKKGKIGKTVKLTDLMDINKDKNNLNIPTTTTTTTTTRKRRIGPRKSIIGMLRNGVIVEDDAAKKKKEKGAEEEEKEIIETESHNIRVVVRIRPVNTKEKEIEHRLLFRHEFDFDDKEYDEFLLKRKELMNEYESKSNIEEFKSLSVEQICEWLQDINPSVVQRFRRRKINGEWMYRFPQFNEKKPLEVDENAIIAFTKGNKSKRYEMDHVLKYTTTQNEAFKLLGIPVVENIIKGYNCTLFAFGQTGTGKTHTMFRWEPEDDHNDDEDDKEDDKEDDDGYTITFTEQQLNKNKEYLINEELDGLIPRILNELFIQLSSDRDIAFFNISCGFIEIYQEKLRDLIRPRLKLTLRYIGSGSEVINLSWHDITCYNDMAKLIETSMANRVTASTLQNSSSSRSHCIIQLKIELTLVDGTNQSSKLSFGDLAGSEKLTKTGASGQRLNEAKKIVKSLFSLKKVIRALSERKAFVPYQDSVLTKLLRDSLGGNSLTMIICCISPHAYNREETLSTLRFAEMAKKIQNEAIVNRIISRKELETQINGLREQLTYLKKQKANKRNRFNSTDFRVLQGQLIEANKKAEEYTQKYLQSEIQLLIKTQYTTELENLLNQKNIKINYFKEKLKQLKENKITIHDIEIDENNENNDVNDDSDNNDNEIKIM